MKRNVKRLLRTGAFIAVLSAFLFAPQQAWGKVQERIEDENILRRGGYYSGSVVAGDLDLRIYTPWRNATGLARLEAPASFRISGYPKLDGATSARPLYGVAPSVENIRSGAYPFTREGRVCRSCGK